MKRPATRMFIVFALTAVMITAPANSQPSRNSEDEFAVNRTPLNLPLSKPKIVVIKSKRRLMLYSGDELVRRYRVGLGLSL